MRYEALSENSGVILNAQDEPMILEFLTDNKIVATPAPKGKRPTLLNKEAYETLIKQDFSIRDPLAVSKPKPTENFINTQSELSPSYQLYLSKELQKDKLEAKAKKVSLKLIDQEPQEITGYE